TGIGDSLTIVFSASTSLSRGTAQRTRSAPASATVRICSIVAARLAVSVLVIVCTATGAPPPIGTPPTNICRFEAMRQAYRGGVADPGDEAVVNLLPTGTVCPMMAPAGERWPGKVSTGGRFRPRGVRLLLAAAISLVLPFAFASLGSAADPT